MGEQKTIEQTFQIESPEIEVGLLGTQDKFVSLIEQGMDVEIRPFGENLKVSGQEEDVKLTIDVFRALISLLNQGIRIHSTDIVSAMKMAHRGTLEYFADLYSETIIKDRRGRAIRVKNYVWDWPCRNRENLPSSRNGRGILKTWRSGTNYLDATSS